MSPNKQGRLENIPKFNKLGGQNKRGGSEFEKRL